MAITVNDLNLCIYSLYCDRIVIEDNTVWADTDEITSITTTITDGVTTVTNTLSGEDLPTDNYGLTSDMLESLLANDILVDGFYTVTVEITYIDHADEDSENTVTYIKDWQSFCNLECKISQLVMDSVDDECQDCEDKDWSKIFEYYVRYQMLCKALACGDLDYAHQIYDNLNELLINFNCKNC